MKTAIIALVALAGMFAAACAGSSVTAIEEAFNLHPGMRMSVVDTAGEHFLLQYRRIEPRADGEYAIVFKVER